MRDVVRALVAPPGCMRDAFEFVARFSGGKDGQDRASALHRLATRCMCHAIEAKAARGDDVVIGRGCGRRRVIERGANNRAAPARDVTIGAVRAARATEANRIRHGSNGGDV